MENSNQKLLPVTRSKRFDKFARTVLFITRPFDKWLYKSSVRCFYLGINNTKYVIISKKEEDPQGIRIVNVYQKKRNYLTVEWTTDTKESNIYSKRGHSFSYDIVKLPFFPWKNVRFENQEISE